MKQASDDRRRRGETGPWGPDKPAGVEKRIQLNDAQANRNGRNDLMVCLATVGPTWHGDVAPHQIGGQRAAREGRCVSQIDRVGNMGGKRSIRDSRRVGGPVPTLQHCLRAIGLNRADL